MASHHLGNCLKCTSFGPSPYLLNWKLGEGRAISRGCWCRLKFENHWWLGGRVHLTMQVTWAQYLEGEDPLEEEMATHSCLENSMDRGAWWTAVRACFMLSCFSRVWLCVPLWTAAFQAPLLTEFSRQEYWSGLPRPPPGDLPDPGIEPVSVTSLALADEFFTTSATWEALQHYVVWLFTMPRNDIWSVLPIVHSAFSY